MMKLKKLAVALAVSALTCGSASADTIDAWRLNLSLLNGLVLSDGAVISGAIDATNVDHLVISGQSTVLQTVVGGSPLNQPFTDSGSLQFLANDREAGSTLNLQFGTATGGALCAAGCLVDGFLQFTNLTGTLNADGSITFNTGAGQLGTVAFWVEDDGDLNSATGGVLKLVQYNIIAPSGGSDLNFFGGGGANATVDVTLDAITTLLPLLFASSTNAPLTLPALHLVNVDSLLDADFSPNPDNTGINPITGNGTSIIHVENAGQYQLITAAIPEPGTLLLLGIGLAGIGFGSLRLKKTAA